MKPGRFNLFIALFISLVTVLPGQKKVDTKTLAPQYQEWLKVSAYIIRDKEKDVFLKLQSDRDRDLFIEAFWRQRDPTPGTPQNEFKEEIIKRFREANTKFRRHSVREGWQTDQGRIHIILGPPTSIERIEGDFEVYSAEIWSYHGNPDLGTPTYFSLVFFQKGGGIEYKLYDPFADGPSELLIHGREMEPSDYEGMYDRIYEFQPGLALVSLSILPGTIPFNFQPSPQEPILMAGILDSAKKNVSDTYATHFLNYKGYVSTDYLTNFIESETYAAVVRDPVTDLAFCEFSLAPKLLSIEHYAPKDQYYCAFQLDVSLRDGDKVVFQYAKEIPFVIPGEAYERTRRMGVSVEDSFPVIEGKYKLTVLLRNTAGKEFSVLEREIEVPDPDASPQLSLPILGYGITDSQPGLRLPYQAENKKVNVDPKKLFAAADQIAVFFNVIGLTRDLWNEGTVKMLFQGTQAQTPFRKSVSMPLNGQAFHRTLAISLALTAADIPPDYYDLSVSLIDREGKVLDEKRTNFVLSPQKALPHPQFVAKASAQTSSFMFYYMLAHQYDQVDENPRAEAAYKKAFDLNPSYKQKIPDYASFLLKVNKFQEALDLLDGIKEDTKLRFSYSMLKGRALMGLDQNEEAISSLLDANGIYNSDPGLLYSLALAYFKAGRREDARNVLEASLKLNPNQDAAKKLLQEIERKK